MKQLVLTKKKLNALLQVLVGMQKQAQKLGIGLFGGSGTGTLRFDDGAEEKLILAYLDGFFDGGDGAGALDECGLLRGE